MKITQIWFEGNRLYGQDEAGVVYSQSLRWYPYLQKASAAEREDYHFGFDGIHWPLLNEDVSFESFTYPDVDTPQFLYHHEIA